MWNTQKKTNDWKTFRIRNKQNSYIIHGPIFGFSGRKRQVTGSRCGCLGTRKWGNTPVTSELTRSCDWLIGGSHRRVSDVLTSPQSEDEACHGAGSLREAAELVLLPVPAGDGPLHAGALGEDPVQYPTEAVGEGLA